MQTGLGSKESRVRVMVSRDPRSGVNTNPKFAVSPNLEVARIEVVGTSGMDDDEMSTGW